jgi:hypothetical protein
MVDHLVMVCFETIPVVMDGKILVTTLESERCLHDNKAVDITVQSP